MFWHFSVISFLIWGYLLFFRGMFWLNRECEEECRSESETNFWPPIVAIVPSRNEAETLPQSLPTLLGQDYEGSFSVIVVDDESEDSSFVISEKILRNYTRSTRLLRGKSPPSLKWTGKVWALSQGVEESKKLNLPCKYYLFTDADIVYGKNSLKNLVLEAQKRGSVLTSLMVKLHCSSFAEKLLIPAFVYFFNMIFPFSWVNRGDKNIAAAAGGCLLVDKLTLERAGGLLSIQSALIDDCSLAKNIKCYGPIWLGFAKTIQSIRKYENWNDIRKMVSRTAFAQLNYSYLLLLITLFGMVLTFLVPPIVTFIGPHPANILSVCVWVVMSLSFTPTLRDYKISVLWSLMLPVVATSYMIFTLDSALQNFLGRGGLWKGRLQAKVNDHDKYIGP